MASGAATGMLVAEHGASWCPTPWSTSTKSRGMGRNGPWRGGKLTERPSAIFERNIRAAPYPEDDVLQRRIMRTNAEAIFGTI